VLTNVLLAMLAGIVYGVSHYAKHQSTEQFEPVKLVATTILGGLIAVGLQISGVPVNNMTVEQRFLVYGGLIPIIENIIKSIIRWYVRRDKHADRW